MADIEHRRISAARPAERGQLRFDRAPDLLVAVAVDLRVGVSSRQSGVGRYPRRLNEADFRLRQKRERELHRPPVGIVYLPSHGDVLAPARAVELAALLSPARPRSAVGLAVYALTPLDAVQVTDEYGDVATTRLMDAEHVH